MIPAALALAAALAAGSVAAQDVREQALRATQNSDWARAAELWAKVGGARAREYQQQAQSELQYRQAQTALAEANAARQAENWAAADAAYRKTLAISPYLREAQQGRARIAPYLEAHRKFAALKIPDGLNDRVGRARAREWLAWIEQQNLNDRKLARARIDLLGALKLAETPVVVTLTSDGKSELEIYGLGKIGRLTRETLQLIPGDYIVVASRAGYRDARGALAVRAGTSPTLDLRCTEKIR